MKIVRWIAAIAVWSAIGYAAVRYVVIPIRCNRSEAFVQKSTVELAKRDPEAFVLAPLARNNLQMLSACLECPDQVNRSMMIAMNLRFLGRLEEAASVYAATLRYERRPELFLQYGLTLVALHRDEEGVRMLITACTYNPDYEADVILHHDEVKFAVDSLFLRLVKEAKERGRN